MRKRERIKIVLSAGEAPEARTSRKGRGSIGIFFGEVRQGLKLTLSRRRLLHTSVRESSTTAAASRLSPHITVDFRSQSATAVAVAKLSLHPLTSNHDLSLSSSFHMTRPLPSSKSLFNDGRTTLSKLVRYPIRGFRWRDSRPLRRIV